VSATHANIRGTRAAHFYAALDRKLSAGAAPLEAEGCGF